ncbi:hypothetical protein CRUP_033559 [Coryphaenoides rupestris]|nr:hypothetical protein CRUP_033559 [Coryphaenoides rupestris]
MVTETAADFKAFRSTMAPSLEARELWKGYIHSVVELAVPESLNLLPGQLHMLNEAVEKEEARLRAPVPARDMTGSGIPCATLHDVIDLMVKETGGVLKPFQVEKEYQTVLSLRGRSTLESSVECPRIYETAEEMKARAREALIPKHLRKGVSLSGREAEEKEADQSRACSGAVPAPRGLPDSGPPRIWRNRSQSDVCVMSEELRLKLAEKRLLCQD